MLAQAVAELPNECCGLLAGRIIGEDLPDPYPPPTLAEGKGGGETAVGQVLKCFPLVNAAASPKEYLANDRVLLDAFRDMRERGIEHLAVYHSHPVTDPVPSKTDLERNYYGDVMHLIISLKVDVPVVRAWRLTEVDYREAEWELVDEDKP